MRDNVNNSTGALLLEPLDLNTDRTSGQVDIQGADAVKVEIVTGSAFTFTSTNKVSWRLQHSDTTDGADFVAVTQADVIGVDLGANGQVVEYVAAITGGRRVVVGYKGARRFLRVVSVKGGTITTALGSVTSELTYLSQEPADFAVAS